jgi:hypothetical protein
VCFGSDCWCFSQLHCIAISFLCIVLHLLVGVTVVVVMLFWNEREQACCLGRQHTIVFRFVELTDCWLLKYNHPYSSGNEMSDGKRFGQKWHDTMQPHPHVSTRNSGTCLCYYRCDVSFREVIRSAWLMILGFCHNFQNNSTILLSNGPWSPFCVTFNPTFMTVIITFHVPWTPHSV